jgi:hypothetical protein
MAERIEPEFVNRKEELDRLREMRTGQRLTRILLIKALPGMGKSWLLRRMMHEHSDLGPVLVALEHPSSYDFVAFVRNLSEQMPNVDWAVANEILGQIGKSYKMNVPGIDRIKLHRLLVAHFSLDELRTLCFYLAEDYEKLEGEGIEGKARELIAYFRRHRSITELVDEVINQRPGRISLEDVLENTQSNQINIPGAEDSQVREWLSNQLIEPFINALRVFQPDAPALILLDTYESNAAQIVKRWLEKKFLPKIRDGILTGVLVVIAGQDIPQFDHHWHPVVEVTELVGIPGDAIREYWVDRRQLPESAVEFAIKSSLGKPLLLAQMADNYNLFLKMSPEGIIL